MSAGCPGSAPGLTRWPISRPVRSDRRCGGDRRHPGTDHVRPGAGQNDPSRASIRLSIWGAAISCSSTTSLPPSSPPPTSSSNRLIIRDGAAGPLETREPACSASGACLPPPKIPPLLRSGFRARIRRPPRRSPSPIGGRPTDLPKVPSADQDRPECIELAVLRNLNSALGSLWGWPA